MILQGRAQQALSIIDDTKAEITDDGQSGRMQIAAIPRIAPNFLLETLQQFSNAFLQALLIVQENRTNHMLQMTLRGISTTPAMAL